MYTRVRGETMFTAAIYGSINFYIRHTHVSLLAMCEYFFVQRFFFFPQVPEITLFKIPVHIFEPVTAISTGEPLSLSW